MDKRSSSYTSAESNNDNDNTSSFWTNERHVHFLNSIEATFVSNMFQNNGRAAALRLDRQLPDSFESTLDLGRQPPTTTSDVGKYFSSTVKRTERKNKTTLPSHHHHPHHDQVVPQVEDRMESISNAKAAADAGNGGKKSKFKTYY